VVLALTTKGYGTGSREADNTTHQVKKLTAENIQAFRDRFDIPLDNDQLEDLPYIKFEKDSLEYKYLVETRERLGGFLPVRKFDDQPLKQPNVEIFSKYQKGSEDKKLSTTMVFVRMMTDLIKDNSIGNRLVPIVPDEARTFGMEALFRQIGIYSAEGQRYEPEDADQVMWYKESKEGVMLEEGITEAGAFSAWIALATSYYNYNFPMIPIYLFYSMFGFQRIMDLAWAAGDAQAKGFLIGATSGRTTLNGEGLQHQDGHSHIMSSLIPNCISYDPAFGSELSVIVKHGINEMFVNNKNCFYYITVMNENYTHPAISEDQEGDVIRGMYLFKSAKKPQVRLLGSGSIMNEVIKAAGLLEDLKINAEIWSVTSFNLLRKNGMETDRKNLLNPSDDPDLTFVEEKLIDNSIPVVAATDYVRAYAEQIRPWIKTQYLTLGTDGYGRSDSREKLREFFEVNAFSIAKSAVFSLFKEGNLSKAELEDIYQKLGNDGSKPNPWEV
jgi:pyruvate dehydrogenase E1 component